MSEKDVVAATEEEFEGNEDHPDGLIHKKKKKKNQVETELDTVTKEDEENMAMKKLLETERELLDVRSLKDESDAEITGLKTELKVLEKNFKELQVNSTQSLEFEKRELTRLTGQIDDLEKEKASLNCQVQAAAIQGTANQEEMECLKKDITIKEGEINDLKSKMKDLEEKHESALKELNATKTEKETISKQSEEKEKLLEENEEKHKADEDKLSVENETLKKEVEDLKAKQKVSQNEIQFMKTEISKVAADKEKERNERVKTSERLKSLIGERNKIEASYKLEMEQLANDFETVKKHLIGITNDKADIWNKLNDHFHRRRNERWVKDSETNNCTNCNGVFTVTIRRHHCRLCGHIFCYKCSNRWLLTPHKSKRIRACDVCAEAYTEIHVNAERDDVDGEAYENYIELKGDDIFKYEADPKEDSEEKVSEEP